MKSLIVAAISVYQRTLRRALPPACRFQPTCSDYAMEAVRRHGTIRGLVLASGRILRCHPFTGGGTDPVRP